MVALQKTYLKLSLDLDFVLIAVTAPLKDYVCCHKINSTLGFNLEKVDDHEIYSKTGKSSQLYSRFYYFVEQGEIEYYFLNNRNGEGVLIPEMNNVDFFIIIHQFIDKEDLKYLITGLNKLPEVQVAVKIDHKKLRSVENLMM